VKKFLYLLLLLLVFSLGYVVARRPRQARTAGFPSSPVEVKGQLEAEPSHTAAVPKAAPTPTKTDAGAVRAALSPSPVEAPSHAGSPPVAVTPASAGDDWVRRHDLEMRRLSDERRKAQERRIKALQERIDEIQGELDRRVSSIVHQNQLSEADVADQKEMEEDLREAKAELAEARLERR